MKFVGLCLQEAEPSRRARLSPAPFRREAVKNLTKEERARSSTDIPVSNTSHLPQKAIFRYYHLPSLVCLLPTSVICDRGVEPTRAKASI